MKEFNYNVDQFSGIKIIRYKMPEFDSLSNRQKVYIYYLSEATLWGRDIIFHQWGEYGLMLRKIFEEIYKVIKDDEPSDNKTEIINYLKQLWFYRGIHHHYNSTKIIPKFSVEYFKEVLKRVNPDNLPAVKDDIMDNEIIPLIFNPEICPRKTATSGEDLVKQSSVNYYQGVSQEEVEKFYSQFPKGSGQPSWGLNSTLTKTRDGKVKEEVWSINGNNFYSYPLKKIVENLEKAKKYTENEKQADLIDCLIQYYITGDLKLFDEYSIKWVSEVEGDVDFINGFIENYTDPLGIKAAWEGIVEYKDKEANKKIHQISKNAQWFEDHSPVNPKFKKENAKGVIANAINCAMLGGEEYPSTAVGINLPNADWIRSEHGSKSITITNILKAYQESEDEKIRLEFVIEDMKELVRKYNSFSDLHTSLHECLGHGSGKLLPETDPGTLKEYYSTLEEARADLYSLYFLPDEKMIELGLLPDKDAYKALYYGFITNGALTQLTRVKIGHNLEEAHMRDRSIIAQWCLAESKKLSKPAVEIVEVNGKHYIRINDYEELRSLIAKLLSEVQRIKSEGDYEAAKDLVETYGVKVDQELQKEALERLGEPKFYGFLNSKMIPTFDDDGKIINVSLDFSEDFIEQNLRYSQNYSICHS